MKMEVDHETYIPDPLVIIEPARLKWSVVTNPLFGWIYPQQEYNEKGLKIFQLPVEIVWTEELAIIY